MNIVIDSSRCIKCGTCVASCSENVFAQPQPGTIPQIVRESLCIACGHCVAMCPKAAIAHPDFPEGTVHPIARDRLPSAEQVFELLRARRSIRVFKDESVERETLDRILDAARFAPSAHNFQTTEYVVVQDPATLRTITEWTAGYYGKIARQVRNPVVSVLYRAALGKDEVESVRHLTPDFEMVVEMARRGEDPILHHAPCLVVAHAGRSINFPEANAFLALHNATLMARALGVGSFLLGYVIGACQRERRIPDLLGVPRNHRVYGALALGYPKLEFAQWVERRPAKVKWR